MGDAGSMMIGFTVIWLLLGASQESFRNTHEAHNRTLANCYTFDGYGCYYVQARAPWRFPIQTRQRALTPYIPTFRLYSATNSSNDMYNR